MQLIAALARSLRLSHALDEEFLIGSDFSGPGWAAILALTGDPEISGKAVVRLVIAPSSAGGGTAVPASYHVVDLVVRVL
jgi:hypothetical protein